MTLATRHSPPLRSRRRGAIASLRERVRAAPWAILSLVVCSAVVGAIHGAFKDLSVYQFAGRLVLDRAALYDVRDPIYGLRFTYPPFAAVVITPLAHVPAWLAAALWTGASMGALAAVVVVARRALGRETPGWLAALIAVGALAMQPVWQTLAFGQVNLILMLVVLVDLMRSDRRLAGVLVGVAAGVKLTPLVFVVLLALVGRRAAAGRAALAFAATVAIGFAVMPHSSATYWTDGLVDAGRVGPPSLAHNQSVYGALTRLLDGEPSDLLWLAIAGPLSVGVLLIGAAWWRRGDPLLGAGLAALAMLLASPVSWAHHWVWAVPVAIAVWERSRWVAAAWTAVFVARPMVWPPWGQEREYGWSLVDQAVGNAYVLAAVAIAVWAAGALKGDPSQAAAATSRRAVRCAG